jgi:hypothetical protein
MKDIDVPLPEEYAGIHPCFLFIALGKLDGLFQLCFVQTFNQILVLLGRAVITNPLNIDNLYTVLLCDTKKPWNILNVVRLKCEIEPKFRIFELSLMLNSVYLFNISKYAAESSPFFLFSDRSQEMQHRSKSLAGLAGLLQFLS